MDGLPKITIINDDSGDWTGLYADGLLLYEGHSLEVDDALTYLKIPVESRWVEMKDSRLPQKLEEV